MTWKKIIAQPVLNLEQLKTNNPSIDYGTNRKCEDCGIQLSRYNPNTEPGEMVCGPCERKRSIEIENTLPYKQVQ